MLYEYECPACELRFEVSKHHTKYKEKENCHECGKQANKIISLTNVSKVEKHEFNHGLGCVVKGRKHRAEICKQRNLVEVGNESVKMVHTESEANLKKKLDWSEV